MKIGLIDVEGSGRVKKWGTTVYPNLALCKIASYHKSLGDEVEWYEPMYSGHCDIVYMSKIFNFAPDYYWTIDADKIVRGGTGYDVHSVLPQEIDDCQPDLSIYPTVPQDTAYGFLTRGCPNKCKWCVVPIKEGAIRPYWDIDRVANGKKKVVLMDNNILAAGDYAKEQFSKIIEKGYRIDFNQAMDARLVTDEWARLIAQVKWLNYVRFGCDTHKQIEDCERAIELIRGYGYKGAFFLYTMLNDDFRESYERVNFWWQKSQIQRINKERDVFPYAQPYRNPTGLNTPPQWQKDMAQWVNKRQIFTQTGFADFEPRKGFKCKTYLDHYGELATDTH